MAKLFIPGPTDVGAPVLEAQARPMIGHRSQSFVELFARIQVKLREVFQTQDRVFVLASSGTGLWEGAMRNVVAERMLLCAGGAFGERWFEVAQQNGVPVDVIRVDWGQAHDPAQIAATLQRGSYDTLALVHNETSTGVENPVAEILHQARRVQPDLITMVDAVSSAGGVDLRPEAWGIDVLVTSSQKCFALPPGLSFAAVSDRALTRAERIPHRGWYFDFLRLQRYLERDMTPATPAVSLLYALDHQLDRMLAEGVAARFTRHARMADFAQGWAAERFDLFAQEGHRSKTVTTVRNTLGIDIPELNKYIAERGMTIANGYGPLKGKTFRVGHMGEIQLRDLEELFEQIDAFMGH
jgi:predicted phosphoserine aminotransferase